VLAWRRNIETMKKFAAFFFPVLGAMILLAADQPKIPAMPAAVSGNAVATLRGGLEVYSMMGIGPKKTWDDVTDHVYVLRLAGAKWGNGHPVPGVGGRLGASAVGAKGKIYVFGGFLLDKQGEEFTVPDANVYLPEEQRWYRAADLPVGVDRAVIGVNHDRYIYVAGGRSKNGPVNNVQVYDVETNQWSQATPFPGAGVFGLAGGLGDDTIVLVDGAKKNPAGNVPPYVVSDECWMGKIDHKDPNKIVWSKVPPHPGPARFGIVGGAAEKDRRILFSGGSARIHDFKGLDAEGKPVELSTVTFSYDVHANSWDTIEEENNDPRSDTGGIAFTPIGPIIVGGLVKNASVTARAVLLPKR
jgi:N-acetylneuraminic acid mutarotase